MGLITEVLCSTTGAKYNPERRCPDVFVYSYRASLLLNQLIYMLQVIFNRFLFLQDKINPTDEKPPLAIDNRWVNNQYANF